MASGEEEKRELTPRPSRADLRLRGLRLFSPVAPKSRRAGVQALRYIFRLRAASSAARGSD